MTAPATLIPALGLIHRALEADTAYTLSRMKILERIPGNPIGIATRRIDEAAVALMARHLPSPSFNRVVGLRAEHERQIAPLVDWYRDHGMTPRFYLEPGDYAAGLGRELARLGYYQSGFHAALIGAPDPAAPSPGGIVIEAVTTAAAMEDYLEAYVAGWGIADQYRGPFKANVRPWLGEPGWSLYLARVAGKPAAAATLYIHAGVAYCADATTDPAFRRRGLQLALLGRRIRDAAQAGVDFVFSGADFLSTSHRNMERVGMRLLSLRAIWTAV
jgi:hypothetical protein